MKLSNSFFITRREMPSDETTISSQLLIRSGMALKNDNGIYSYLPMGLRVIENIKKIIREELNEINATEVLMPSLTYDNFEDNILDEVYKIVDRMGKDLKLSHSSEKLFISLVSHRIKSYKDLHFSLFQINQKYRDEERTEYGLIRKKEFLVSEGYSFDADEGGLDVSYDKMFLAFKKIFNRLSLDTLVVRGSEGDFCEEFQVMSDYGDNRVVRCTNCAYTSNIEDATSKTISILKEVIPKEKKLVLTKDKKTIREVSEYLDVFPSKVLKSLICKIDGKYKMIVLKGDSELNIKKLKLLYNTNNIEMPTVFELEKMGTKVGYIGPVNCTMDIIADNEVKNMYNFVCGSNKKDYHYMNVNYGRDFSIKTFADLKLFDEKSLCPKCKSECEIIDGIEIGQITKLGNKNTKKEKLVYTDEVNSQEYVHMGSYVIGIDRCLSAIVEKHHDENGIIWPMNIAPYKVAIIVSNVNDSEISKYANTLYSKLINLNIDTVLDDRKESIGVKFNDIDLVGIPIRITIGRRVEDGFVELKLRNENKVKEVKTSKIVEYIQNIIEKLK